MDQYVTKEITQEHGGRKYRFPFGVYARNVETDDMRQFVSAEEKEKFENPKDLVVKFDDRGMDASEMKSGTTLGKLMGQIKSWISKFSTVSEMIENLSLGTAAKCDTTEALDVTEPGLVSDARALKVVNDKFGSMSFERQGDAVYAVYKVGADTVRKKLGNEEFIPWKTVDLKSVTDRNQMRVIEVDCRELPGYTGYGEGDFLVVPASVYQRNVGMEYAKNMDARITWSYGGGTLRIQNSIFYQNNSAGEDSQFAEMWYSSFEIYVR